MFLFQLLQRKASAAGAPTFAGAQTLDEPPIASAPAVIVTDVGSTAKGPSPLSAPPLQLGAAVGGLALIQDKQPQTG